MIRCADCGVSEQDLADRDRTGAGAEIHRARQHGGLLLCLDCFLQRQARAPGDTRGPARTRGPNDLLPVERSPKGPLVYGPLVEETGPLVPTPRVPLDDRAAGEIARRWGAGANGNFPCPIPGHSGVACLERDESGELYLRCCKGRRRPLGEVEAAIAYGQDSQRTQIENASWLRRLASAVDAFEPYTVDLPPLPPEAATATKDAADGFGLLIGLRWADGPRRPVAYSVRFCAAWNSLPTGKAGTAIKQLIAWRVIRVAEKVRRPGSPFEVRLFLPGDGSGWEREE
jgi:hypothetical protein